MRIPFGGLGGHPGRIERHLFGHGVDLEHGDRGLARGQQVGPGQHAGVGAALAVGVVDQLARVVDGIGFQAQLLDQGIHAVLCGADEGGTALDHVVAEGGGQALVPATAADTVARFQQQHLAPGGNKRAGTSEAGVAAANDDHVGVVLTAGGGPGSGLRLPARHQGGGGRCRESSKNVAAVDGGLGHGGLRKLETRRHKKTVFLDYS